MKILLKRNQNEERFCDMLKLPRFSYIILKFQAVFKVNCSQFFSCLSTLHSNKEQIVIKVGIEFIDSVELADMPIWHQKKILHNSVELKVLNYQSCDNYQQSLKKVYYESFFSLLETAR